MTLRYWDEIGLFAPAMRNPESGYRYYSPQQVTTINFVKVMGKLDIPLKRINDAVHCMNCENIIDLIEEQERLFDAQMHKLRESYSIIHTRRALIKAGLKADVGKISVKRMTEKAIILGPKNDFTGEAFYEPFMHFCNSAEELRINLGYPIGAYHGTMKSYLDNPSQPEHFFSLDPTGNTKWTAGKYLEGYARGYYGEFGDLPERMTAYAEEHALSFTGPVYAVYLLDEICISDPSQYLVQVSAAVSSK